MPDDDVHLSSKPQPIAAVVSKIPPIPKMELNRRRACEDGDQCQPSIGLCPSDTDALKIVSIAELPKRDTKGRKKTIGPGTRIVSSCHPLIRLSRTEGETMDRVTECHFD